MYGGKAEQAGAPFEIYNKPATRFVASFVGTLNMLNATVVEGASGTVDIDGQRIVLGRDIGKAAGAPVTLALRPEAAAIGGPGDLSLKGRIADVSFLGSVIRIRADVGASRISFDRFNSPNSPPPVVGEACELRFAAADVLVLND
jgi:putative spermidine/putrescine transport system ATP-binding protein